MLPSFDSPLNPEIREVAIAHVANGVKCAMAAFLKDRRLNLQEIVDEQRKEGWRVCKDPKADPKNPATCKRCPNPNHWYGVKETKIGSTTHYSRDCVDIPGPRTPSSVWAKFEQGRRFALDRNKKASVEISLNATNTGRIDYTKINRKDLNLGPLTQFISGGNNSDPFPSLSASAKATNTVVVSFAMEQKIEFPDDEKPDELAKPSASPQAVMSDISKRRQKSPQELADATAVEQSQGGNKVLNIFGPEQFESDCATNEAFIKGKLLKPKGDKTTFVDYLGIKKLLNKLLDDVERDIYTGTPELALDQLTLTSQFQLTLEASAGTYHILRIVPVVVPPTVKLSPDRTHQLKITLKGGQQSIYKDINSDLENLCYKNLGAKNGDPRVPDIAAEYCKNPQAKHLQYLIEKLDSQKTTTTQ